MRMTWTKGEKRKRQMDKDSDKMGWQQNWFFALGNTNTVQIGRTNLSFHVVCLLKEAYMKKLVQCTVTKDDKG